MIKSVERAEYMMTEATMNEQSAVSTSEFAIGPTQVFEHAPRALVPTSIHSIKRATTLDELLVAALDKACELVPSATARVRIGEKTLEKSSSEASFASGDLHYNEYPIVSSLERRLGELEVEAARRFGDAEKERLQWVADVVALRWESLALKDRVDHLETRVRETEQAHSFHLKEYRSFITQSSEGMSRFQGPRGLSIDLPVQEQIDLILENAFLAECNLAMARMYGFSEPKDLLGVPLKALLIPSEQKNIDMLRAFIESGYRLTEVESTEVDRDGNLRYFVNSMIGTIENGELVHVWGTQRDITEKRLALQALEKNEQRLQSFLESNLMGVCIWSDEGEIIETNEEYLRITGLTRAEYEQEGLRWREVTPPEYFERDEQAMRHIGDSQSHRIYEKEYIRRDGTRVPILIGLSKLRSEPGRGAAFVVDITDRKRIEAAYKSAADEAAAANLAKSRFVANMSHEIRTPLGILIGFADLALETEGLTEDARFYLKAIRRNGEQLLQLIGDVLDLAKIESAKIDVEASSLSLPAFVKDIVSLLQLKAVEKNVQLDLQIDSQVPEWIRTDPLRLRQILVNIVGNALKFTHQGQVRLSVGLAQTQPEEGALLRFEVRDTGIGIPDEFQKRLYQPFTQADASLTRRYGGSGLGLMLSRELARALGGELELVESQPDRGSTFAFTIRVGLTTGRAVADAEKAKIVDRAKNEDLKGLKILIAEDSPDNRMLLGRYLRGTGAEIDFVVNGQEAVVKASEKKFDVVLMDLQMPILDGGSATRKLRDEGFSQPIFALTAHALREERERALQNGFDRYLTKPVSRSTLLDALSSLSH